MRYNLTHKHMHATSELVGIAACMVYDGIIDDTEINFLQAWLKRYKDIHDRWPMSELYAAVGKIVADGKVTLNERKSLYKFLQKIAVIDRDKDSNPQPDVIQNIYAEGHQLTFLNKCFLFTGELVFGERKSAMLAVAKRGGLSHKSSDVTQYIDYLIVGSLGNINWASGKFGRKIETAMTFQKNNASKILIIKEDDFVQALFETPVLHD